MPISLEGSNSIILRFALNTSFSLETLFSPTVIEENMLNRYYDYRVENLTAEIFFKLAAFIKLS